MFRFMKRCKAASTEDAKAQYYINVLLSSVEYETFVKLMKIMRPIAETRLARKAEDKTSASVHISRRSSGSKEMEKKSSKGVAIDEEEDEDDDTNTSPSKADAKLAYETKVLSK